MTIDNLSFHNNIENKNDAPCLINCGQGVSVLYKERYLYSKYNPEKAIKNIISNIQITDDSLVLIFSPALWIGLQDLLQKLGNNCKIVAFEFDKNLYDFSIQHLKEEFSNRITFFNSENQFEFIHFIQSEHFKKVIKIVFSAGVNFFKQQYEELFDLTESIVNQFWKNRLTLIKFGRLFSKNIFKNLIYLPHSIPIQNFYNSIEKTILVLGAGESLNITINQLKKIDRDNFFIIAVDAALNLLLKNKIIPDAVVAVESQIAIQKAYIGLPKNSKTLLICDLVSRHNIPKIVNGKTTFFISNFANITFFDKLKSFDILPNMIQPLGSVGLVAMKIALLFRNSAKTKILFSGLDFAYTCGITHAKETMSHIQSLISTTKLKSIYNIDAAFSTGTNFVNSKNNQKMITTISLQNYANLFIDLFLDEENIFDLRSSGIDLKFNDTDIQKLKNKNSYSKNSDLQKQLFTNQDLNIIQQKKENILNFIQNEINDLSILKDILINGENSSLRQKLIPLPIQINNIIKDKEYLFIHFPDAFGKTNMQSFYNRLKIEIMFFLKELKISKSKLEKL